MNVVGVLIGVYSITDLCIIRAMLEHTACVICVLFNDRSTTIQLKYIEKYFLSHLRSERGDWREVFLSRYMKGSRRLIRKRRKGIGRDTWLVFFVRTECISAETMAAQLKLELKTAA